MRKVLNYISVVWRLVAWILCKVSLGGSTEPTSACRTAPPTYKNEARFPLSCEQPARTSRPQGAKNGAFLWSVTASNVHRLLSPCSSRLGLVAWAQVQATMEPLLALTAYLESMKHGTPKEAVKEATDGLLRGFGSALARSGSCNSIKDVQKLCQAVMPFLRALLDGVFADRNMEQTPQYLPLLLELSIPANLVKFMALALRAGHPMVALPESAKEASALAAAGWSSGADLYSGLVGLCHNERGRPHERYGNAVIEQLAVGCEGGEPGETSSQQLLTLFWRQRQQQ